MTDEIRAPTDNGGGVFPFTARQWQELEYQALAFKYIVSATPLPPHLVSTVLTAPLFPQHQLHSTTFGWGCFQVGNVRNTEAEAGRCRRTDGKKWRCSKEACPNSKYCERHVNRGKSKSKKKQTQGLNPTTNTPAPATEATPSVSSSHQDQPTGTGTALLYPYLSPQQSSRSTLSDQNQSASVLLMDHPTYHDQRNKTIRFEF